jgi:hypothetical protein
MYVLVVSGHQDRPLGEFTITEPRFTLARLINPDNRDTDGSRFIGLFGDDARTVARATNMTLVIDNLHADYPDVEIQLDTELEHDPEVDVDELVNFVQKVSGVDLDALPDNSFTLTFYNKAGVGLPR